MSLRNKKPEAAPPAVPSYIVTFSDMVTLLLTFFVLLLSMAEDTDPAKYQLGQEAFKRSLANFGLRGILYTVNTRRNFNEDMVSYPTDNPEDEDQLVPINAQEEKIRRIFNKLSENMKVRPSCIRGKLTELIIPQIRFSSARTDLTNEHKRKLSEICSEISLTTKSSGLTIYVVGLAQGQSGQNKWITASKRADNAANYIKSKLTSDINIYNWGTAQPSEWVNSSGAKEIESDILIAIIAQ